MKKAFPDFNNENEIYTIYIHRGGKYDISLSKQKLDEKNKPDYEIHQLYELFDIVSNLNKEKSK